MEVFGIEEVSRFYRIPANLIDVPSATALPRMALPSFAFGLAVDRWAAVFFRSRFPLNEPAAEDDR